MRRCAYILAWLLLVLPTAAGAVPFGVADILSNFNAVVQGNFSTSSDVAGPVAIGGTISGTGTFFNQGLPMGAAFSGFGSVNVYGNASNATYNANMIVVDVGGTGSNATFSGASAVRYGVSYPISFSSLWAPLTALSAGLSTLSPTSAAALPSAGANNAVLSATAATVKGYGKIGVIDISASLLQSYTGVSVALNGADTVIINVTVVSPSYPSFLTIFPADASMPTASSINFVPGQVVGNLDVAKVGAGGQISIYNLSGLTNVVVTFGSSQFKTSTVWLLSAPTVALLDWE